MCSTGGAVVRGGLLLGVGLYVAPHTIGVGCLISGP